MPQMSRFFWELSTLTHPQYTAQENTSGLTYVRTYVLGDGTYVEAIGRYARQTPQSPFFSITHFQ